MLDQVGADGTEPPSRQRPAGTMTHDDEVCSALFGDPRDLLSRGSHAQPRRWREAHGFEPLYAFRKNCFISCDLLVHRDHDTPSKVAPKEGSTTASKKTSA